MLAMRVLGCFLAGIAVALADPQNPINKVIQLLLDLEARVVSEGKDEATEYSKFGCFCRSTTTSKSTSILDRRDKIQTLSSEIESKTSLKATKADDLKRRQADHESVTADLTESETRCAKAKEEYEAEHADLSKALSSLSSAINSLQSSKPSFLAIRESVAQGVALANVMNLLGEAEKKDINAFLQIGSQVDPNDAVYKYHSQGIIDILTKLEGEFQNDFSTLQTEWSKTEANCQETQDSLKLKLQTNSQAMVALQADIDRLKGEIAEARDNVVSEDAALKDDQLYLHDLTASCEARAKDWDQRSQMRADELTTLKKALSILHSEVQSPAVRVNKRSVLMQGSGSKVETPSSAERREVQTQLHGLSFIQETAIADQSQASKQTGAAAYLRRESQRLHSSVLSNLALHADEDPFDKVKVLIQKLIQRLLEESTAEAEKKGWCDTEVKTTKETMQFRYEDVKSLSQEIAIVNLKIDELGAEIAVLDTELNKLREALRIATNIRPQEKHNNEMTIKDATQGIEGVKEAILILKVFYKRAAKATVLVQSSPVDEDTTGAGFKGAYTGRQDSSKAIIGFLEVIQSDFDRTIRVTEDSERKAAAAFVEFDRASKADIEGKETKKSLNKDDLVRAEDSRNEKMVDLKTAQTRLDTALQNLDSLKSMCIDSGMSYRSRVAQREEEILALKKALCILTVDPNDVAQNCHLTPR